MSDRYPGTTTPALERRFKALRSELQKSVTQIVREAARQVSRETIVVSEDLSAHLAAADPHPQYATDTDLTLLTLLGLADVDGTGVTDGDALIYEGGVFVPGAAGRPGITYRTIPEDVRVDVVEGEQYLVFQELVVDGELFIDGGEVVVMSPDAPIEFPLDAFGRVRVSDPVTIFDAGHQYNLNDLVWDTGLSSGTGSVTHLPDESAVELSTGGTASGALAVIQSRLYHRYQPGKSQLIMCTGAFGAAVADVRKRYGYFDGDNGLFFEQTSAGVGAVLRSRTTGSVVDTRVEQADWNLDKLDGTGPSKITVDFDKAQIFLFDLEWLGVGRVRYGIVLGGEIVYVHGFSHVNTLTGPYMTSANLPIRAEIENTGTAAATATWKQICASVISEGGQEDDRAFLFSGGNGTTSVAVTTRRPILTIRPKLLFNSLTNRGQVIPVEVDVYTSASVDYELVLNGALTGASFASAGDDSIAELDVSATAIAGGTVVKGGFVATAGTGAARGEGRNGLLGRLALVLDAAGAVPDTLSVVATSFSGTANVSAKVAWREFR